MSFFIEVGSCDFDTCERLINNGWSGIVIEPVKYYYDKLPKYPNIKYENIAISDKKGESSIHYINPETIKNKEQEWLRGISSIKSETGPLSLEENSFMKDNIIIQKVNTDTLQNICDKYNVRNIDYLKIDTEGYDLIVLKGLDLDKVNVKMIKIEHKHLNVDKIIEHLKKYNYMIYTETDDIYAIK
jgi:FkbM family methyltransferase